MGIEEEFMAGGGGKSFPFDRIGDTCIGTIVSIEKRQQTDVKTGAPKVWERSGEPKMMYVFGIQTDLRVDEEDTGIRSLYIKWKSEEAIKQAVRASGARFPEVGGKLALTYSGDGAPERGQQPPKLYTAQYRPPAPGEQFMDQPAAAPAPVDRDHHGNPQGAAPAWAMPPAGAATVGSRPSTLDAIRNAETGPLQAHEVPF